jgi:hypothetical protein
VRKEVTLLKKKKHQGTHASDSRRARWFKGAPASIHELHILYRTGKALLLRFVSLFITFLWDSERAIRVFYIVSFLFN